MFLSWKDSDSTSKVCLVTSSSLCQCLSNMALLDIISSRGHVSLKSSILFFSWLNACHSLSALGSLRHLHKSVKNTQVYYFSPFSSMHVQPATWWQLQLTAISIDMVVCTSQINTPRLICLKGINFSYFCLQTDMALNWVELCKVPELIWATAHFQKPAEA